MRKLQHKPGNGSGLLAIFCDLASVDQADFRPWLIEDMFPARQKIGFKDYSKEDLIAAQYIYPKEARHELTRIYHIYDLIDRKFKNFEQEVYSDEKAITGPNGEKTFW